MSVLIEQGQMAGAPYESGIDITSKEGYAQISPERIYSHLGNSLSTIISLQNPESGLTQAATDQRHSADDHMNHFWLRDHAIGVLALSNGARNLFPVGSVQRDVVDDFTRRSVDGLFEIWKRDEWQEGFGQPVIKEHGHTRLKDPMKAPPIHALTSGEVDFWWTQNQPDAWGFAFTAISRAVDNGVIEMNEHKLQTLEQAVRYLDRLEPEHATQTSMWEWGQPGLPPLSSVAIVRQGFEGVARFIQDPHLKKRVGRRIEQAQEFVTEYFPVDYTTEKGHESKSDLATLVALAHGALDRESFFRFMNGAAHEIIPEGAPGVKRFIGDHYHKTDEGEPVWFMGLPYMATINLKRAELAVKSGTKVTAKKFAARGMRYLERAYDIVESFGWPPELFERRNGVWVIPQDGTASHIGWNDAALLQASAQALRTQELLGNKYTS